MPSDATTTTIPPSARRLPPLPVDGLRAPLLRALRGEGVFLLEAPPGTGKSTRVPVWALDALPGRVLLLEPRRAAARMLAAHLADLLGCRLGGEVGLVVRGGSKAGPASRLLVLTEGVFARMVTEDPALEGVSCVLFDEFHERRLTQDEGLALALRSRSLLRPDLAVGVLSATLDLRSLSAVLPGAAVLSSEVPGHPVRTVRSPVPGAGTVAERLRGLPAHLSRLLPALLAREAGSALVFLPGAGEIARAMEALEGRLPADCDLLPLHGSLPAGAQAAALLPPPPGRRKVVLSTDVAETSVTIEGVRIVVDSGLQRRPAYEPARGSSRLVTRTIPLSSASQRRGRAGRTEPGLCVRLWSAESEAAMPAHPEPEILGADLSGLALDLAAWGEGPEDLPFPTPPPAGAYGAAKASLVRLGAVDAAGRATPLGVRMASLGLPPGEARILLEAGRNGLLAPAAVLCAFLAGDRRGGGDLRALLPALLSSGPKAAREEVLAEAALLFGRANPGGGRPPGASALAAAAERALGDPALCGRILLPGRGDRLAVRTGPADGPGFPPGMDRWTLRNGSGCLLPALGEGVRFALALETSLPDSGRGGPGSASGWATATLFCPVAEADALAAVREDTVRERRVEIADGRVEARETVRAGALVLESKRVRPTEEEREETLLAHLEERGLAPLPWAGGPSEFLARLALVGRLLGAPWPDVSREELLRRSREWLPKALKGAAGPGDVRPDALLKALKGLVPGRLLARLDELAPREWTSPCGRGHAIVYGEGAPRAEARLQECFGLAESPVLPCGAALVLRLLSPAGRPLAVTGDLAFFWREAYPGTRAEMRGRYPRHPWPEDPLAAEPTALTNRALRAASGRAKS